MTLWSIFYQTWTRALMSSCTLLGWTGRLRMRWSMMSQRCSMGLRSGEHAGQSIASMPSSSRNLWHTLATCGRALSWARRNPGPTAPAYGRTKGRRISSLYLTAVRVPRFMTWRSVRPSRDMPPQTITDPPPNLSRWTMLAAWYRSP